MAKFIIFCFFVGVAIIVVTALMTAASSMRLNRKFARRQREHNTYMADVKRRIDAATTDEERLVIFRELMGNIKKQRGN